MVACCWKNIVLLVNLKSDTLLTPVPWSMGASGKRRSTAPVSLSRVQVSPGHLHAKNCAPEVGPMSIPVRVLYSQVDCTLPQTPPGSSYPPNRARFRLSATVSVQAEISIRRLSSVPTYALYGDRTRLKHFLRRTHRLREQREVERRATRAILNTGGNLLSQDRRRGPGKLESECSAE